MKNILRISSTAALVALAAPAMASTIVVDDFTTSGSLISNQDGNAATGDFSGSGILGGTRTMWVSSDSTSGPYNTGFSVTTGSGILEFINGTGVTGQAVLIYDGGGTGSDYEFFFNSLPSTASISPTPGVDDDGDAGVTTGIDVDTDGLNVDLLQGGTTATRNFQFDLSSFDADSQVDFRAYAWDRIGGHATYDEMLTSAGTELNFTTALRLDQFSGTIDWTQIGALAFSVESISTEFDGAIGEISVVPLPASALLLLGGLGGLAGVSASRRRRRKS